MSIDMHYYLCYNYNPLSPSPLGGGKQVKRGICVIMDEKTTKIINRLKSIEGHVRGVEKMIEDDAYCIDIVKQIEAIQAALHVEPMQIKMQILCMKEYLLRLL